MPNVLPAISIFDETQFTFLFSSPHCFFLFSPQLCFDSLRNPPPYHQQSVCECSHYFRFTNTGCYLIIFPYQKENKNNSQLVGTVSFLPTNCHQAPWQPVFRKINFKPQPVNQLGGPNDTAAVVVPEVFRQLESWMVEDTMVCTPRPIWHIQTLSDVTWSSWILHAQSILMDSDAFSLHFCTVFTF